MPDMMYVISENDTVDGESRPLYITKDENHGTVLMHYLHENRMYSRTSFTSTPVRVVETMKDVSAHEALDSESQDGWKLIYFFTRDENPQWFRVYGPEESAETLLKSTMIGQGFMDAVFADTEEEAFAKRERKEFACSMP